MLILAIDTSQPNGSFAFARGRSNEIEVLNLSPVEGGAFSAQLIPQISHALAALSLTKGDIGLLVACSGPGSFTGLRIGLAAVKGLAEVLKVRIVTVSSLQALASLAADGEVLAALDARRGEVFAGVFAVGDGSPATRSEALLHADEFARRCANRRVVTNENWIADLARPLAREVKVASQPQADRIARLGWLKFQLEGAIPLDQLDASYLRRDENLFFKKP